MHAWTDDKLRSVRYFVVRLYGLCNPFPRTSGGLALFLQRLNRLETLIVYACGVQIEFYVVQLSLNSPNEQRALQNVSRFVLESANAVAVGTFNIHIFSPPWLVDCGIAQKAPENVEVAISRPGFRIHLEEDDAILTIEPNRIQVTSPSKSFDCGVSLSKILKRLPETPVIAVGVNAVFKSTLPKGEEVPVLKAVKSESGGKKSDTRIVSLKFNVSDTKSLSISLEQTDRLVKALVNAETKGSNGAALADSLLNSPATIDELVTLLRDTWNLEVNF